MLVLALESSAVTASAAVLEDEKLSGEIYVNINQTHSQTLMPMVASLLSSLNKQPADFDLFSVSSGPGSFTGVRIGVSCVKGLALPTRTLCCGVSTLEGIAYNAIGIEDKVICSVMDARCEQVYNALFRFENGALKRICEDRAVSLAQLEEELTALKEQVLFVGDGTDLCISKIRIPNVSPAPEAIKYQKASSVALAAARSSQRVTPDKLLPLYLRLPQAERELRNKNKE